MKRILLMVLRNIILVPYMWCKLCYHAAHVDKYTEEEHYKMLRFIVLRANKGGNVTIEVHGQENIPDKNGFMFFLKRYSSFSRSKISKTTGHTSAAESTLYRLARRSGRSV